MNIGKQIRFFREQMGLSQKELAESLYISERSIGHYETEKRIPPIDKLQLLANALEVEISELIGESKKSSEDWFQFFVHHPKQEKRKHMDEKRFRLFLKRTGCTSTVEEDENWITSDVVCYPKQLGKLLTNLLNESIICTAIIYEKTGRLTILGYIGHNSFKIEVIKENECLYFHSKSPFYENQYLSFEFKIILNEVINWFQKKFPNLDMQYSIETMLYIENMEKDCVLDLELDGFHFSNYYKNITYPKLIKKINGYHTLRGILEEEKSEKTMFQDFFSSIRELLRKVESWQMELPLHSVASLPSLALLFERYPNSMDIPINLIDVDINITFPFFHRGYQTLGDICEYTKEEANLLYGSYGIYNKVSELETLLSTYHLQLKNE